MMDKSELLFQMMEQPEKYSEEQWREILADEECRELYTMSSMVRSAVDDERVGKTLTDAQLDREWDRFRAKQHIAGKPSRWRRIAAAAIAIVFVSLAIAAVYTNVFGSRGADKSETTTVETVSDTPEAAALPDQEIVTNQSQPLLYDNIPLEQIINELSNYYHVKVEWRSDEVRDLRLYYQWEPTFTLDKVVDMLNSFEAINITREGDKIIIDQSRE